MKKYFLFLFFVYSSSFITLNAQRHVFDSLKKVLETQKNDTNKVITCNLISNRLWRMDSYDTAMMFADSARLLAEKLNYGKGVSNALRNMGTIYYNKGLYPKALDYYFKAMTLDKQMGYKKGIAGDYSSIGNVYYYQADFSKSLDNYMQSLVIARETKDKESIGRNMGNIANIYYKQNNLSKAAEYDSIALVMKQEIGDKTGAVIVMCNIGQLYNKMGNYAKALQFHFKALQLARKVGYKSIIALNLSCIGQNFDGQKNYIKGKVYLDSSLAVSASINGKEIAKGAYRELAELDSITGNFKQGLEDYKKFITVRDSLVNEANTKKTVQAQMNYDFEQKQAAEKAEQDKKDAIAEQDKNKQKVIRNSFIAGFALMLALAFFIFRGYRQKQKANEVITQQKEEVEKQKTMVEQQKAIVEEKNKDILDSITYAKRLQDAILPPLSIIKQYLPESFVLYKPKDIVAGDFYWMEKVIVPVIARNEARPTDSSGRAIFLSDSSLPRSDDGTRSDGSAEVILIAAADCTGHGVPGALVSVVCSNALNRTVKEFKITEPGKILDKVRELVLETFEKSEDNVQDGMDISLCAITFPSPKREGVTDAIIAPSAHNTATDASLPLGREGVRVDWAGANNSLWYIENNEMKEIAPDKQPIGKYYNAKPFTTHTINISKNSPLGSGGAVYLFTDGYADQFGGEKGKKFKYKQLQQLIMHNVELTMEEQKRILEKKLQEWKGDLEQVDDVLIIGIRV